MLWSRTWEFCGLGKSFSNNLMLQTRIGCSLSRRDLWLWGERVCLPEGPEKTDLWVRAHFCPLSHGLSLGVASVFCVSLDPKTNTLAVTGGEDDKAFVWRLSDGELLFECAGERLGRLCSCGHVGGWPV